MFIGFLNGSWSRNDHVTCIRWPFGPESLGALWFTGTISPDEHIFDVQKFGCQTLVLHFCSVPLCWSIIEDLTQIAGLQIKNMLIQKPTFLFVWKYNRKTRYVSLVFWRFSRGFSWPCGVFKHRRIQIHIKISDWQNRKASQAPK